MFQIDKMMNLFNNDRTMVLELLKEFIDDSKSNLELVLEALSDKELDQLHFILHKMKPSILYFSDKSFSDKTINLFESQSSDLLDYKNYFHSVSNLVSEAEAYYLSQK